MRPPMLSFFLIAAALLGEIQAGSAQSAYSYPWCSKSPWGGSIACRYSSYEQCRECNYRGICVKSPYYQGEPAEAVVQPRRREHLTTRHLTTMGRAASWGHRSGLLYWRAPPARRR